VYLTTGGGPAHFSEVLGTHIFRTNFFLDQSGYAAALSVVTLLIAFVATIIQMRFLRSGLGPTGASK